MSQNIYTPLGIDISKQTFDAAIPKGGKRSAKFKTIKLKNDETGFAALVAWLEENNVKQVHACLEATNIYSQALASFLYERGERVSIVNPAQVKGYAQSQLKRTKNDQADAGTLAQFCRDLNPRLWKPSASEVQKLQRISRRRQALQKMLTQEKNRLQLCCDPELETDIQDHIEFLKEKIEQLKKLMTEQLQTHKHLESQSQLLCTIKGIGASSAAIILAEIGSIQEFSSARQLAAFAGLTPREFSSGTSVRGKTRLCKIGNSHLRTAFYFPALSAIRHCPPIRAFYDRLLERDKTKMQAIGAVMHKLIRVVFGVLRHQTPFDPTRLDMADTSKPLETATT
jgi:transposase